MHTSQSQTKVMYLGVFLARVGAASSRRKGIDLVRSGAITLNNQVVTEPSTLVKAQDVVEIREPEQQQQRQQQPQQQSRNNGQGRRDDNSSNTSNNSFGLPVRNAPPSSAQDFLRSSSRSSSQSASRSDRGGDLRTAAVKNAAMRFVVSPDLLAFAAPNSPNSAEKTEVDSSSNNNQQFSAAAASHEYVLLNKPLGVVTATSDNFGRTTVLDHIARVPPKSPTADSSSSSSSPSSSWLSSSSSSSSSSIAASGYLWKRRLFPIGRLDINTTGALLLTSDGVFSNEIGHPSRNVAKVYAVTFDLQPSAATKAVAAQKTAMSSSTARPSEMEDEEDEEKDRQRTGATTTAAAAPFVPRPRPPRLSRHDVDATLQRILRSLLHEGVVIHEQGEKEEEREGGRGSGGSYVMKVDSARVDTASIAESSQKYIQEATIIIEIHSGKNRIIRRLFDALGHRIRSLHRISVGGISCRGLKTGEWRYLAPTEVDQLRRGGVAGKGGVRRRNFLG